MKLTSFGGNRCFGLANVVLSKSDLIGCFVRVQGRWLFKVVKCHGLTMTSF